MLFDFLYSKRRAKKETISNYPFLRVFPASYQIVYFLSENPCLGRLLQVATLLHGAKAQTPPAIESTLPGARCNNIATCCYLQHRNTAA